MYVSQRPLTYSTVGKGSILLFALSDHEETEIRPADGHDHESKTITSSSTYRVPSKVVSVRWAKMDFEGGPKEPRPLVERSAGAQSPTNYKGDNVSDTKIVPPPIPASLILHKLMP